MGWRVLSVYADQVDELGETRGAGTRTGLFTSVPVPDLLVCLMMGGVMMSNEQ